jgi:hypothetical protein
MMKRRQNSRATKPLLMAVAALGLLLLALPTTMVLAIGMAPTLGAFFADKSPGRYLTKCVAAMNLAGVIPSLYNLWITGHDLKTANNIVTDPYTWLVMYCAGAMGWLLFLGLPGVVAVFRSLNATRRIYVLREKQKLLINEWGDCILPAPGPGQTEDNQTGDAMSAQTTAG